MLALISILIAFAVIANWCAVYCEHLSHYRGHVHLRPDGYEEEEWGVERTRLIIIYPINYPGSYRVCNLIRDSWNSVCRIHKGLSSFRAISSVKRKKKKREKKDLPCVTWESFSECFSFVAKGPRDPHWPLAASEDSGTHVAPTQAYSTHYTIAYTTRHY